MNPPTERQIQVAELASRGLTDTEIAGILHITKDTVKSHLAALKPKVGAKNTRHLTRRLIELGYIEIEEIETEGEDNDETERGQGHGGDESQPPEGAPGGPAE